MPGELYDGVPYTDHAYAEAHPDRLAVVARMSGWDAPPVESARVLELGCGRGGNLVPMAASLPGATLLGVDASARQVDEAARVIAAVGARNVSVVRGDVEALSLDDGSYDFIVCHGVLSWVPIATRRAIFAGIARWLAPGGVAYVSANTLPGWYARLAARDWLRFGAASLGVSPTPDDARASLAWLRERAAPELDAYRAELDAVRHRLGETDPAYLVHEYLAPDHHPELVTTLLAEAGAAGLRYLGDAIPTTSAVELLPDDVAQRVDRLDAAAAQQMIDFVRDTAFRRMLLVRADSSDERGFRFRARLDAGAVSTLRIASRLHPRDRAPAPDEAEPFEGPDGAVTLIHPAVRAALHELASAAPRALAFPDLAQRAARRLGAARTAAMDRRLADEIFDLWLGTTAIDLHAYEAPMVTAVTARPAACPVARWHALRGGPITNRWHHEVVLPDALVRFVLGRLDGTRTLADVTVDAAAAHARGALPGDAPHDLVRLVGASAELLAASSLLTA